MKSGIISILFALAVMASWGSASAQAIDLKGIASKPRSESLERLTAALTAAEKRSCKDYKKTVATLEEQLSEPTWPSHNEELFAAMLGHASVSPCLKESERIRPAMLLEMARKNAPGTVAADIAYVTPACDTASLSDVRTPLTLVFFNDPECLSCAKVKERLDTTTLLRDMAADGTLTVIGIYPYDNIEEWRQESFPGYIINGRDYLGAVESDEAYDLMMMPLFYLLDGDRRVLLKNEASLNRVVRALNMLKPLIAADLDTRLNALHALFSQQ